MNSSLNVLIGLAIGLNLVALGTGRLQALIRIVALQGVILGCIPLLIKPDFHIIIWGFTLITVLMKGFVIPSLLRWASRAANVDRDVTPMIGFVPSLLLGAAGMVAALMLSFQLPLLPEHHGSLLVGGSMATIIAGFLLLVGRSKAIAQICGYLVLENGIYLFGLLLVHSIPLLVEAGILLDLIVGVFVAGIVLDRIQRTFDSLDTRNLNILKE